MGAFVYLTLLLPNLNACKYRFCECILAVVRRVVYCERCSGYRVDVSCFANKMCLFSTIQTHRCGRSWLFNLIVAEFQCKYCVCECSLVVVRHIVYCERFSGHRADVSCFTNTMCVVSTIQTDRCGRICFFKPYRYQI